MKTIAMKLVSGEELIGRFCTETATEIKMSHIRVIGLQQDQSGNYGVGLVHYVVSAKDAELSIKKDKMITVFEPSAAVEKAYLQNTSGLAFA